MAFCGRRILEQRAKLWRAWRRQRGHLAHILASGELTRDRRALKSDPLNLLIEAPLSVAFNANGNPVGRSIERLGSQHRYWYEGLGCLVMTSALYLLRGLHNSKPQREVRLFEGFVSFKPKGQVSSHCADVQALRAVVWATNREASAVVGAGELATTSSDRVVSAFAVAGMDFGVPPVVQAMANIGLQPLQPAAADKIMSRRG